MCGAGMSVSDTVVLLVFLRAVVTVHQRGEGNTLLVYSRVYRKKRPVHYVDICSRQSPTFIKRLSNNTSQRSGLITSCNSTHVSLFSEWPK